MRLVSLFKIDNSRVVPLYRNKVTYCDIIQCITGTSAVFNIPISADVPLVDSSFPLVFSKLNPAFLSCVALVLNSFSSSATFWLRESLSLLAWTIILSYSSRIFRSREQLGHSTAAEGAEKGSREDVESRSTERRCEDENSDPFPVLSLPPASWRTAPDRERGRERVPPAKQLKVIL